MFSSAGGNRGLQERKGGGTVVPDFATGLTWMNAPPLSLKRELRGRIVVLDFWTYCCINWRASTRSCSIISRTRLAPAASSAESSTPFPARSMHVLPELARLEKKWADSPITVVGVHSAKFDNEKDTENIRQAVLRYGADTHAALAVHISRAEHAYLGSEPTSRPAAPPPASPRRHPPCGERPVDEALGRAPCAVVADARRRLSRGETSCFGGTPLAPRRLACEASRAARRGREQH